MSYQYCLAHNKVSAWGCPVCRSVELRRGMDEAAENANRAIREAFSAHPALSPEAPQPEAKEASHD